MVESEKKEIEVIKYSKGKKMRMRIILSHSEEIIMTVIEEESIKI
ncbi:MAG: hypothetical protein ACFFD4_23615 [Candidatus Odinarchaeota archaeon]